MKAQKRPVVFETVTFVKRYGARRCVRGRRVGFDQGPVAGAAMGEGSVKQTMAHVLRAPGHDLCERGHVRPSDLGEPALISDEVPAGEDMPMQLALGSAVLRAGRCLEVGSAESVLLMVSSRWGLRWSAVPSCQMTKPTLLSWHFQWADADFP